MKATKPLNAVEELAMLGFTCIRGSECVKSYNELHSFRRFKRRLINILLKPGIIIQYVQGRSGEESNLFPWPLHGIKCDLGSRPSMDQFRVFDELVQTQTSDNAVTVKVKKAVISGYLDIVINAVGEKYPTS